ncbi:MAG: AI-2E family transporter, partial [Myxococcota bacterium]
MTPSEPNVSESVSAEEAPVYHSPGAIALFLVTFVLSLFAFLYIFWGYVTDFILAFMFTALFGGVYERLRLKLGDRPLLASGLVTTLIAILVAVPVGFILASLSVEAAGFYNSTLSMLTLEEIELYFFGDGPQAVFLKHMAELAGLEWTPALVQDTLTKVSGTVAEVIYGLVSSQLSNLLLLVMHFFIMLLIIFYMLIDGQRLKAYVFDTSPLPDDEEEPIAKQSRSSNRRKLLGNELFFVVG